MTEDNIGKLKQRFLELNEKSKDETIESGRITIAGKAWAIPKSVANSFAIVPAPTAL